MLLWTFGILDNIILSFFAFVKMYLKKNMYVYMNMLNITY